MGDHTYTAEFVGKKGRKFVMDYRCDGFWINTSYHKNMRALRRRRDAWLKNPRIRMVGYQCPNFIGVR